MSTFQWGENDIFCGVSNLSLKIPHERYHKKICISIRCENVRADAFKSSIIGYLSVTFPRILLRYAGINLPIREYFGTKLILILSNVCCKQMQIAIGVNSYYRKISNWFQMRGVASFGVLYVIAISICVHFVAKLSVDTFGSSVLLFQVAMSRPSVLIYKPAFMSGVHFVGATTWHLFRSPR